MKHVKLYEEFLNEKKPAGAPEWKDSDAPDAEGRFRDLGIKDLAAWLIKSRKKDLKKISGSLTQQVVFNRKEDPEYAEKMEKVRQEVYKQLGREDLMESASDSLKLQYVTKTHQDFATKCKRNFKGIVDDLFSEGYHTYKVKELTISISIDDLLNASGDSAVGQYDDETQELSITLFPVLQKIKYGSGYIGIGMIDDLEEITDEERDIYIGIIKDALTNPRSVEFGKIKDVFVHELVHHWDNVNYGSGYAKNMDDLENTRHEIEDKLQRDKFYFGMPHEINARFIQALSTLMDNHGSGFGDYRTFEEMFLPYFINYSMLSQDAQNKIKKRLFYFFENDLKDFN